MQIKLKQRKRDPDPDMRYRDVAVLEAFLFDGFSDIYIRTTTGALCLANGVHFQADAFNPCAVVRIVPTTITWGP